MVYKEAKKKRKKIGIFYPAYELKKGSHLG